MERLHGLFDVLHHSVLGDLQAQQATWEVVVVEAVGDQSNDVAGGEEES